MIFFVCSHHVGVLLWSTNTGGPKSEPAFKIQICSGNSGKGANGIEISWQSFQKSEKCQISEMRTIHPKISEIPGVKLNVT